MKGYERFFGFTEAPFSLAPNTRFLFDSASHAEARAEVAYALERREPLVVIIGEIGTGKTLLCRTVLERLDRKTFLSVINDPQLERDELLKQMLQQFGVISKDRTKMTPTSRHELIHALQEFLLSLAALQAQAVVIIDEAQHLQPDVLEQIRLISNIHDDRGNTMLQIILAGQTSLEPLLARPELRQLKQRVSRHLRLSSLSPDEVAQYIGHRLKVARERHRSQAPGAQELAREIVEWEAPEPGPTFTPEAIRAVSQLSGGIPRVVNLLCDRALEAAYGAQRRTIDVPLITAAARALDLPPPSEAATPTTVPASIDLPPEPVASQPIERESFEREHFERETLKNEAFEPEPVERAEEIVPDAFEELPPAAVPAWRRPLALAATLVLAVAVIWFGGRALNAPRGGEPQSDAASPTPDTGPATPSVTASAPATPAAMPPASVAPTAAPAGTAAAPNPGAAGSTPTAGESTDGGFEIVIASFRTVSRARGVAAQVVALGTPARLREASGWHQVLAGPFASRSEALDAQQRLDRNGLGGTTIVPVAR
jgi:type II secretory pathway predicted ATPase ExeA/cell division protein FtsN